jgi:hypothetical protein
MISAASRRDFFLYRFDGPIRMGPNGFTNAVPLGEANGVRRAVAASLPAAVWRPDGCTFEDGSAFVELKMTPKGIVKALIGWMDGPESEAIVRRLCDDNEWSSVGDFSYEAAPHRNAELDEQLAPGMSNDALRDLLGPKEFGRLFALRKRS